MLDSPESAREDSKKYLAFSNTYHTYQLKADQSYTVYVRNLNQTTYIQDIKLALEKIDHVGFNVTNVLTL